MSTSAVARPPMRRVALSVLIGTTIEWYDFLIYGSAAAIVFPALFFPNHDEVAGTLLAFSTFAVGFGARPLGGVILGHFGDRLGRKKMLVLSLTMMGVATFLVGLMPTYETLGVAAPILLVLLRILQGFGVGGEWGGAVLSAVEYATPERRGFYGSLPQIGVPAGLFLSTVAFLAVSRLPEEQFMAWGWRLPFLASIVLVGIGLFVRLKLAETPAFERVQQAKRQERVPLIAALRNYPVQILLATGSMISTGAWFYVVNAYALSYGPEAGGFTDSEMLAAVLLAAVVAAVGLPIFGAMSERRGRKPLILLGLAVTALWIFPTFMAIDSGNLAMLLLTYAVGAVFFSVSYGPQATFIAELFEARVRFSASSTSFQLGVMLGGALAPIVATALVAATGTSMTVAGYVAALSVVSFLSVLAVSKRSLARGSADMGAGAVEAGAVEEHAVLQEGAARA
jgi:MFS transporter, MHS family, shikimate and dehydroshikimate transport protein